MPRACHGSHPVAERAGYCDQMTPEDEPTPTDETPAEEVTSEETEPTRTNLPPTRPTRPTRTTRGHDEHDEGVEAEGTLLERSQATIDDAREAVKKVAATDAIGEDATGAGDLPPFADSTDGAEKPDPDDA